MLVALFCWTYHTSMPHPAKKHHLWASWHRHRRGLPSVPGAGLVPERGPGRPKGSPKRSPVGLDGDGSHEICWLYFVTGYKRDKRDIMVYIGWYQRDILGYHGLHGLKEGWNIGVIKPGLDMPEPSVEVFLRKLIEGNGFSSAFEQRVPSGKLT